jgi:hypothetical protein
VRVKSVGRSSFRVTKGDEKRKAYALPLLLGGFR